MKRRNQLLALGCLIAFFAFGVFYFRTWVVQKPFGIILFVGEGMDPGRLAITRIYAGGAETPLTIDSLPYNALLKNYSKDYATPDQAAAATALATGVKVKNGAIGVDADGKALANLIELAQQSGRTTGLITNGRLTDPTLASFYAHAPAENERAGFARALIESANIELVLGGGSTDFLPENKEGNRTDGRDLVTEISNAGYDLVQTLEDLEAVPRWRAAKVFGLFSRDDLAFSDDEEGRGDQPTLSDMVRRGIEVLQFNSGGYLLVVDAALMGRSAHAHDSTHALSETVELDRAVSVALHYAGTKSMIIVCGDVGIGGLTLSGLPPHAQNGVSILQPTSSGGASLAWATGSARSKEISTAQEGTSTPIAPTETEGSPLGSSEAPALNATNADYIATDVVAFGTGLGADSLQGTLESTAIFEIIRDNL